LAVLGIELGLVLPRHTLAIFALVIFQIGSCIFDLGSLGCDLPIYIAGMTGTYHHAWLID
jgi:hypothetical protein